MNLLELKQDEFHISAKNAHVALDEVLDKIVDWDVNVVSILDSSENKAELYVYENENLLLTVYIN